MLVLMLVLGLLFAPALVTVFAVIDEVTPAGTGTEAITWLSSLAAAGSALGAVVAGLLVNGPGVDAAFAGAAGAAAAATAYALLRRRTLSA